MNPNEEFFEIYDAYVEYNQLLKDLSVKLGRQKYSMVIQGFLVRVNGVILGRWTWGCFKGFL